MSRIPSELFAVYGTLRVGERANNRLLNNVSGVKYWGQDTVDGTLLNIGAYPGFILDPIHSSKVVVDLYKVADSNVVEILDQYEGYPILYGKDKVMLNNSQVIANIYTWNGPRDYPIIDSGDWRNREQ